MENLKGCYKIESSFNNGWQIHQFIRHEDGSKEIKTFPSFNPYFYISENAKKNSEYDESRILSVSNPIFTNLYGDKVRKIETNSVKTVRDFFIDRNQVFEADILYHLRYLIDNVESIEKTRYRINYIDIETTTEYGFPNIEKPEEKIICITIYDNFDNLFHVFTWEENREEYERWRDKDDRDVHIFPSERMMLQNLVRFFSREGKNSYPDILVGWNIINFDAPYLLRRMEKVIGPVAMRGLSLRNNIKNGGIEPPSCRIGNNFGYRKYWTIEWNGLVLFDLFSWYRTIHKGELSSYALEAVAAEELGEKKMRVQDMTKLWKKDLKELVEYNVKDVDMTIKIQRKGSFIDFVDSIRSLACCNFEDCQYYSRIIDIFILRYAKKRNIVLPTKRFVAEGFNENVKEEIQYEGGYVFANPGLYDNVAIMDMASLYPNLIMNFNLSPETIRPELTGDIKIPKVNILKKISTYEMINGKVNKDKLLGVDERKEIRDISFTKEKGLLPSIIDELFKIRAIYKQKKKESKYGTEEFYTYDMRQQAAKNLICTVYGVNALPVFRLYKPEIAATITHLGRNLIKYTRDQAEQNFGHKVVLMDTDSIAIKISKETKDVKELEILGNNIVTHLNEKAYKDFCQQFNTDSKTLEIKMEKIYSKMLITAKKRYAGSLAWRDGHSDKGIDITGLEVKRSDRSKFSKDFQKEVIDKILSGGTREELNHFIWGKVLDMISLIEKGEYEDIALPTKLEKNIEDYKVQNIPRIRGSNFANDKLGCNFSGGDKFLMLYAIHPETDVVCFDNNERFVKSEAKVDLIQMAERNVFMILAGIWDVLGWSQDIGDLRYRLVMKAKNQKDLNHFLKTSFAS